MSVLTVLVAPRGPAGGVLDVLQDYSALGLLDPFLWVDPGGVTPSRVTALEVRDGRRTGTTLEDALAHRQRTRVRVCVLVPKVGDAPAVSADVEHHVADLVQATSGGARVDRIRCVLTRAGSGAGGGDLAREGWHNVLVAPEESQGPGRAHTILPPSTDPVTIARHAAPVVAGVLGLWRDVDDAPLQDLPVLPGRTVRTVRSFYRRLDASDVEQALRSRVLSMAHGTPLPREHGQPAAYVEDVPLATGTMAAALWTKHAGVLRGPRVPAAQQPVTKIGALAALRMLFGFLWAAVKNAPGQWYARTVNRVSSTAAGTVHSAVFGAGEAAYTVVVKGVTGSGLPAGWAETADAGARLDDAVTGPALARAHEPGATLAGLWRDYAAAALTLADGGRRDPLLPPVQIGATRGVLRSVADCVPSPGDDFTEIPGYVAATLGVSRMAAADVLGQADFAHRLDHLARDPAAALDADRTRQALSAWQRSRERSFAAQVGGTLATQFRAVSAEIAQLVAGLGRAAAAQDPDAAGGVKQRRLARWMRIVLALFLLLVVVVVTLGAAEIVAWDSLWPWLGWGAGTWLVVSLLLFLTQQRELFRELNRRREVVAQADAMRANLRQALQDQRRLAGAYRQFLGWSRVLGAFLAAPFGDEPATVGDGVAVGEGLPRTTRFGRAVVDEEEVAEAAVLIRRDVFTTGWLTAPFEAAVEDVGRRLGVDGYELREHPDRVFEAPGGPGGTALTRWGGLLEREGSGTSSADALWGAVLASLVGPRVEIGQGLVSRIAPATALDGTTESLADFMAGVDGSAPEVGRQRFDGAVLTQDARMRVAHAVEQSVRAQAQDGLGRVAVLTQLGEGLPAYEYAVDVAPVEAGPVADPDWVF